MFLSLLLVLFFRNTGFFWDNVLFGAKMGEVLYENGIFNWNMPDAFDPGHPPFLAMILALGWKIFGKTLLVSHLVLLPFVFGLLYQLDRFVSNFVLDSRKRILAFILIISDPTLFTQLILINPEVIQLFFFFLALNGLIKQNRIHKILGLFFLGIVTYRGMMLCAGLFLIEVTLLFWVENKNIRELTKISFLTDYLIGALPALIYVFWRLTTKGWLQTHPDSPWSSLWQFASLKDFIRNGIVLTQRYLDYGRIVVFAFVIGVFFRKTKLLVLKKTQQLLIVSLMSVFVIVIVSLFTKNTMGHRYFIVSYIAVILLSFILLDELKYKKIYYVILLIGLVSGNLWIYPPKIAQGWDASLAHLPYWKLRIEAIEFMDKNNIPIEQTASFFPNGTSINNIVLNDDERSFVAFTGEERYVFYSTVYNLGNKEFILLKKNYSPVKEFERNRIHLTLFKRNDL